MYGRQRVLSSHCHPLILLFLERNRISLNGTFISNGYLLACTVWGNVPRLNTVGCSPDGQRGFRVGEGWEQGQVTLAPFLYKFKRKIMQLWWQCVWEGDRLQPRQSGCLHPSTKRPIGIGEQLDVGDSTLECQQSANGALRLVAVGCIACFRIFAFLVIFSILNLCKFYEFEIFLLTLL